MIIDLTKPLELPNEFVRQLNSIKFLCRKNKFSDELVDAQEISHIVKSIDSYCMNNKIIGVHYTRANPCSIREQGLLVRNGKEIRDNFLAEYGHIFSKSEIDTIRKRWSIYFTNSQSTIRDGYIYFNFTDCGLYNGGAEYLIGLYGGEQDSMCFEMDEPIGVKLGTIGEPLLVRCALEPANINTSIEYPWGKILVSSFHLSINPNAYCIDQDGFQNVPVFPKNIIEISTLPNQRTQQYS